ncbi:hypothetical protein [Mucilaginibacter sp. OK098]|uniref:hypothetical protein n=1 Tax=Mucilaginibacter sp. OK098 TaxID=1855297 RepID=UPI00090FEFC2|nr:hypothetical protein [Mucilaginibacter sp. OK098]SHN01435.1 hypothetical protein SAMN05216524_104568 [Mucilaginibacter sp. OK098]
MEVFFIKYRKMLLFGSVFMLLYFFYEMYKGIESINSSNKGEGIGTLADACIALFVSVYFFINVRKAKRAFKEENAAAETNSDTNQKYDR